jgi:KDO2-lipid IV(A) lauroyltransferase
VQYLLTAALLHLCALLPLRWVQALGAWIGARVAAKRGTLWRVSAGNLALCYPQQSDDWRTETTQKSLEETGKSMLECAHFWYRPLGEVDSLVHRVHGAELPEVALAEGRGMILCTPHLGAWELSCMWSSARWPMSILYKPGKNARLDALVKRGRERAGAQLLATDASGVRALVKTLARGGVVGLLPDQEPTEGTGVFADFFDTPAYTMVLLNKLVRKHRVPVIFAATLRRPNGNGFELYFLRAGDDIYDPDPVVAARAVNACVERCVALAPEQYMWNYKRFRHQPDGTRRRY